MISKRQLFRSPFIILIFFAAVSISMILLFWSWHSTDDAYLELNQLIIQDLEIQTEKIYQELEDQIVKFHGQIISVERLINEDAITTGDSTYAAQYLINLKVLNEQILLNLVKEFALIHALIYKVSSIEASIGEGIKIVLEGTENQKLTLLFKNTGSQEGEVKQSLQATQRVVNSNKRSNKRLVLIIDDFGNDYPIFKRFLKLQYDLTYAILPLLPLSEKMSQEAHDQGREVILHVPMEPQNMQVYKPGPGVLLINDSPYEIANKMERNFASIKYEVGTNNHMGSAFTQDKNGLDTVMSIVGAKNLFFIDSKTASGKTARLSASDHGVPYLSRDIFLDNEQDIDYITRQLDKAINIAKKSGYAIAIGHPYAETAEVLENRLGDMEQLGITIVPASSLLN